MRRRTSTPGGAYAARVQWRVLRDEKLAAARDGKRIKQALERAIALDPDLHDAYFGIGLYQVLRRRGAGGREVPPLAADAAGRRQDRRAARRCGARETRGKLLQGEADYQLHILYFWYEKRADLARRGCSSRWPSAIPGNPLFPAQLARSQDRYEHDITASLATWRALLASARDGRVNEAEVAAAQARLGIARQLEALQQTDQALEHLARHPRRQTVGAHSARWRRRIWRSAKRRTASAPRRSRRGLSRLAIADRAFTAIPTRSGAAPRSHRGARPTRVAPRRTASRSKGCAGWRNRMPAGAGVAADAQLDAASRRSGRALPLRARAAGEARTTSARSPSSRARSATRATRRRRSRQPRTTKRRAIHERLGRTRSGDHVLPHRTTWFGGAAETRDRRQRARSPAFALRSNRYTASRTRSHRAPIVHRSRARARTTSTVPCTFATENWRDVIFDIHTHFVLDSWKFSSIIYILYEGGSLSPPVVTPRSPVTAEQPTFQGGTHGEESSKGRQEKGRQEALAPPTGLGGVRATLHPRFFLAASHPWHLAASRSDERRMDAPPTCLMAAALRYGEGSSRTNPTRRGG